MALGSCGLSPRSCFLFYLLAAKVLLTFFVSKSTGLLRPEFLAVPITPCMDPTSVPRPRLLTSHQLPCHHFCLVFTVD